MPRPKKRKIEEVEATAEDSAEIDCETGIIGEVEPVLDSQSPVEFAAAASSPVRSAAAQKKWMVAKEAFWEATMKTSMALRTIAAEHVEHRLLVVPATAFASHGRAAERTASWRGRLARDAHFGGQRRQPRVLRDHEQVRVTV